MSSSANGPELIGMSLSRCFFNNISIGQEWDAKLLPVIVSAEERQMPSEYLDQPVLSKRVVNVREHKTIAKYLHSGRKWKKAQSYS